MVSPALSQLLERARARFGLEVEVLDAGLNSLYPEGGTDLSRIIQDSPVSPSHTARGPGGRSRGAAGGRRGPVSGVPVTAIAQAAAGSGSAGDPPERRLMPRPPLDAEPWSDLARAVVETDLAATNRLATNGSGRAVWPELLRFIEYITETTDETLALARARAGGGGLVRRRRPRLYQRDLSGDFVLEAWLPGVQPEAASARLSYGVRRLPVPTCAA